MYSQGEKNSQELCLKVAPSMGRNTLTLFTSSRFSRCLPEYRHNQNARLDLPVDCLQNLFFFPPHWLNTSLWEFLLEDRGKEILISLPSSPVLMRENEVKESHQKGISTEGEVMLPIPLPWSTSLISSLFSKKMAKWLVHQQNIYPTIICYQASVFSEIQNCSSIAQISGCQGLGEACRGYLFVYRNNLWWGNSSVSWRNGYSYMCVKTHLYPVPWCS